MCDVPACHHPHVRACNFMASSLARDQPAMAEEGDGFFSHFSHILAHSNSSRRPKDAAQLARSNDIGGMRAFIARGGEVNAELLVRLLFRVVVAWHFCLLETSPGCNTAGSMERAALRGRQQQP